MKQLNHVIVVGAGPGGLAAAKALQVKGVRVTVLERAPRDRLYRDTGGSYEIRQNTLRAMDKLGVGDALRDVGGTFLRGQFLSPDGTMVRAIEYGTATGYHIRRSGLQRVLLEHLGEEGLRCSAEVKDIRQDASGVEVVLDSGEQLRADLLIGADGLRSVVRAKVLGEQELHFCNCVCWWARTDLKSRSDRERFFPGTGTIMIGKGGCFVGGLIKDHFAWTYFYRASSPYRITDPKESKAALLAGLSGWSTMVQDVAEESDPETIVQTPIWDRDTIKRWTSGRVALLGDAVHPMAPFLAQGANSALIDAFVLAEYLSQEDIATAFRKYEERRVRAVNRQVSASRQICLWCTSTSWLKSATFKTIYRMMPETSLVRNQLRIDDANDVHDLISSAGAAQSSSLQSAAH